MADGSVTIDTKLDGSGVEKGINVLKGGFDKIGSIATKALKGATVTIGAVSTALTGISIAATNSYADLEQNIGGVETLFGDSAQKVIKNAENAYKTAGMSANQYMSTVTSFSASLLQSLGGDTEKAADVADMALTDMSDNANKMGTSMELIQNAYQGFAKQNYTMLDNLKLGYGGTKTEMERLLADAEKLTGVKFNIDNLNDVYQAIHVIQGELGITGTTAKEAASTISGSITSMKAAFDNFLNGSGTIEQLVDTGVTALENIIGAVNKLLPNIVQSIADATPKILEGINKIVPQILDLLSSNIPVILTSITQIITTLVQALITYIPQLMPVVEQLIHFFISATTTLLPELIKMGVTILESLLGGISQNLDLIVNSIFNVINLIVSTIIELLPQLLEMGIQIIIKLALGIAQQLPELIPQIIDCVILIVETLLDNIDLLIDAGIQLIIGLSEGLINALPKLIDKIPVIIDKLVNAIVNNLPKLIEMGIILTLKLAEGLIKAIPQLVSKIPQIITAIVNGLGQLVGKMVDIGKNIVSGIWQGISNMANWLLNKIASWCDSIFSSIKDFFGIHSPSRLFRDEIGENLGLGLGEGFEQSLNSVYRNMKKAVENQNAKLTSDLTSRNEIVVTNEENRQAMLSSINNNREIQVNSTINLDGKVVANTVNKVNANQKLQYGY